MSSVFRVAWRQMGFFWRDSQAGFDIQGEAHTWDNWVTVAATVAAPDPVLRSLVGGYK